MLLSRDEGFGYSYFEAAAVRTPSVLADEPIFHETAASTALFAEAEQPSKIAAAIEILVKDAAFRNTLGNDAYQRVLSFNTEIFKRNFLDAVENNEYYEM